MNMERKRTMVETKKIEAALCTERIPSKKSGIRAFLQNIQRFMFRRKTELQELRSQLTEAEESIRTLCQIIEEKENRILKQESQLLRIEAGQLEKVERILLKAGKLDFESMDEEERFNSCCFPIAENPENGKWDIYMNICSLGGCEYNGHEFNTEREAYLFGYILTQLGATLNTKSACPECYAEYMQNCI